MSIVSDLHQGLGMNVCSGHGRHSYMTRMYADKNIHIAFVLEAGRGVTIKCVSFSTDLIQSIDEQVLWYILQENVLSIFLFLQATNK